MTTTTNDNEFGTTPAYRIGERVEARGLGDAVITGTVTETRGTLYRDTEVNVEWDHLGRTNWEPAASLRSATQQMIEHTVVVYLNDSRDASFGFDNEFSPAELRKVAEFGLRAWHRDAADTVLSGVFAQLNIGGTSQLEATDYTEAYRAAGNRSLSVGDVVVLDGLAWACGRYGWDAVTTAAVTAAVSN